MKKTVLVIVLILIVVAFFFIVNKKDDAGVTGNVVEDSRGSAEVRTFVLAGENFKFTMDGVDNPELRVKQGDTVYIDFTSTSGFHDWVVDEFDAATERVKDGSKTSVAFVVDKKGTFEYYCSVGEHRAKGMKGNLVVE